MANDLKDSSYLFATQATFIEALYEQYLKEPESIDSSWIKYFQDLKRSQDHFSGTQNSTFNAERDVISEQEPDFTKETSSSDCSLAFKAISLIKAYMDYGHTSIQFDPLGLARVHPHMLLDYASHGLKQEDLKLKLEFGSFLNLGQATIEEAVTYARKVYSSGIGLECSHLENVEEKEWLHKKLQGSVASDIGNAIYKKNVLRHLIESAQFENFLHVKFPGTKRFSIEGGESAIVAIEVAIENAVSSGVNDIVIGMAHRGRLAVLTKVMSRPHRAVFAEFAGEPVIFEEQQYTGDVKYHMGASTVRELNGKRIQLSLTPNPSHLEAVNSVVLGQVRAKQSLVADRSREKIMAVLIHGDAALAGQGSVFESLVSSQLEAYRVGGALHLVINNQLGFTTQVEASRFGRYCTDVARSINAPVLHVNGNCVEDIVLATKIATEYRAEFGKDIFLDIICYRRYGHNESDEPLFTQPLMYQAVVSAQSVVDIYAENLIAQKVILREDYQSMIEEFRQFLNAEFEISKSYQEKKVSISEGCWSDFVSPFSPNKTDFNTGVVQEKLQLLGKKLTKLPEGFHLNNKIARQFQAKSEMIATGQKLDWAMAESLAYATLLDEGYSIRITGQDVERGTFSHRHAVLVDQKNESKFVPLNNLADEQSAQIEVKNSNLSEFAVLAFEYGYSVCSPRSLVVWEAQFGDFANGAQVIIDQFIASGEVKWMQSSGIVLLLPHGYEGQGSEHSSARLERFLQLCAQNNMQVVNCSTPASFFHVMRRQLHRNYRMPLVVMTPKSLLRHESALSNFDEMNQGTCFRPVISDNLAKAVKLVFCSGKVYYDLVKKRATLDRDDIAIVRIEQLYPFPETEIKEELLKYRGAAVFWCQEEHFNGGAYLFLKYRIELIMKELNVAARELEYIGRESSASTAAGHMKLHTSEFNEFMRKLFYK